MDTKELTNLADKQQCHVYYKALQFVCVLIWLELELDVCWILFIGDALIYKHPVWVHISRTEGAFHSSLTVQSNARHLYMLPNRTTALNLCLLFNTSWFSRLVTDWLVENITPHLNQWLDGRGYTVTNKRSN